MSRMVQYWLEAQDRNVGHEGSVDNVKARSHTELVGLDERSAELLRSVYPLAAWLPRVSSKADDGWMDNLEGPQNHSRNECNNDTCVPC